MLPRTGQQQQEQVEEKCDAVQAQVVVDLVVGLPPIFLMDLRDLITESGWQCRGIAGAAMMGEGLMRAFCRVTHRGMPF